MIQSKKVKWIGLSLFVILFLIFSGYRYHVVNKPFESYSITETSIEQNKPVVIEDVTYEYGATRISEDEDKFIYEIPLTIENHGDEFVGIDYENLVIYSKHLVQNGIPLDEVINHPENEDSTAIFGGVPPGEEDEVMLMFFLMKDWKVEQDTNVDMYYRHIRGDTVVKYKLPLNY